MYLKSLGLVQFKNYESAELEFSPKINCFIGDNGVGKTNLLDAIHYLCLCKSYFNPIDSDNILYGKDFAVIQGDFVHDDKAEDIYCGLQHNKKKIFKRNKKEYSKLSDHIGLFPLVMISPADYELILDGGEERRKFMNNVISQYNRNYLELVLRYNKTIAQRNRLLKSIGISGYKDETLDVYNEQMISVGEQIYLYRKEFTEKLVPIFQKYYEFVSDHRESVELIYQSQLAQGNYSELLAKAAEKERILQYSVVGPHKDDLALNLFGYHIKKAGSQGQQKTYLVALKLAQFDFIQQISGKQPILLLDDVFDKFDETRVKQIIKLVAEKKFGQIFITHTNFDRIYSVLSEIDVEHKMFRIEKEGITNI